MNPSPFASIEVANFPRVSVGDELVLRFIEVRDVSAIEIADLSEGRVSSGTIYSRLSRIEQRGFVRRVGRWYVITELGKRILRACDAAAAAFAAGEPA